MGPMREDGMDVGEKNSMAQVTKDIPAGHR